MHQSFAIIFLQAITATFFTLASAQLTLEEIARRYTLHTPGGGIHVPIMRWKRSNMDRNVKRAPGTVVGLGDYYDWYVFTLLEICAHLTVLKVLFGPGNDRWNNHSFGCG